MNKLAVFLFLLSLALLTSATKKKPGNYESGKQTKYVAFSADTEAYFTSREFEQFEGEYTSEIIEVCNRYDIPFTWLIIVDKTHSEVKAMSEKHFSNRKNTDEFSLHTHFKWFIMDNPGDFESFKIIKRRLEWLENAREAIIREGLPLPKTFRYGGGDSNDKYYHIKDLIFLTDKLGIENFLFDAERLKNVIGIQKVEHLGNNVWNIDGERKITLLSTCVYLDKSEQTVIERIEDRLETSDYAIIGCHDYRKIVPENMEKALLYMNENYKIKYVTIDQIGKLVRSRKIKN